MFELKTQVTKVTWVSCLLLVTWANDSAHYYFYCTRCRSTLYHNSLLSSLIHILDILQSSVQHKCLALEKH